MLDTIGLNFFFFGGDGLLFISELLNLSLLELNDLSLLL
jgi:hypothetical protein